VTWGTCSLRQWLNSTFISNAFNDDEQKMIQTTKATADKNPYYSTSLGEDTEDKLFLLSITEVEKYLGTDEARKCVPTDYAIARGAYTNSNYTLDGKATCWWWLRSPGYGSSAAYVKYVGSVCNPGVDVNCSSMVVRPALWIDLSVAG
jgi:hypothetical protein